MKPELVALAILDGRQASHSPPVSTTTGDELELISVLPGFT